MLELMPDVREVKRVRDADGAACLDCNAVFMQFSNPYWGWRQSQAMHENGMNHKMRLFAWKRPVADEAGQ